MQIFSHNRYCKAQVTIIVLLSYLTASQATAVDSFIGATAATANTGAWTFGTNGLSTQTSLPYSNWAATQTAAIVADDVAYMSKTDGTWKNAVKATTKTGYLCEASATSAQLHIL